MFRGFAARKLMRTVVATVPKRAMGGGHGKPPPTGGIDGAVRKIFPEDHQVSMAIIGGYFTLYLFSKLFSGGKKNASIAAPASGASDGAIPSVDSPAFAEWVSAPGNIEKALS